MECVIGHRVKDFIEFGQQSQTIVLYVAIRLNTGFVFIEANIGVQSRHTDINARLARDVVRIGFPELAFVKNILREFNYVDMIVIAVPHGGVHIAWLWSLR